MFRARKQSTRYRTRIAVFRRASACQISTYELEAGGIDSSGKPSQTSITPHLDRIAIRCGTHSDTKVHQRTQKDKEFRRSTRKSTRTHRIPNASSFAGNMRSVEAHSERLLRYQTVSTTDRHTLAGRGSRYQHWLSNTHRLCRDRCCSSFRGMMASHVGSDDLPVSCTFFHLGPAQEETEWIS